jgi:nucleotide-binding universal stress UspA family protein
MLVGVDGSRQANVAVHQASRLAQLLDADLEMVHAQHGARVVPEPEAVRDRRLRDGRELVAASLGRTATTGARAMAHEVVGPAGTALLQEARATWADLICLGPDRSIVRTGPFGRVAAHVLHHPEVSVLIARGTAAGRFPRGIVCAVDGSPFSLEAVRVAAGISARARVPLTLVHIVTVAHRMGRPGFTSSSVVDRGSEADAIAHEANVEPRIRIGFGAIPESITTTARIAGADLIVVGSRGLTGLRRGAPARIGLGSVSDRVARHAPCSVLVVRPRQR